MANNNALFLFGTGASSCVRIPDLLHEFIAHDFTVYSVLTPNVAQVAPAAPLMDVPGNHWIHTYRQPPLDRYPFGTLLVAPCTFNTFNKIANGLADNLATAMIADGLGAGFPVIIAPSMNRGLWAHPHTSLSRQRLQEWGCEIIPPMITDEEVTMAPTDQIVEAVLRVRDAA
ncbi:MAG: flavoprotein [Chloroflexota bacterium]|nr:flavoprotein [Chloroflexota bacterium]